MHKWLDRLRCHLALHMAHIEDTLYCIWESESFQNWGFIDPVNSGMIPRLEICTLCRSADPQQHGSFSVCLDLLGSHSYIFFITRLSDMAPR